MTSARRLVAASVLSAVIVVPLSVVAGAPVAASAATTQDCPASARIADPPPALAMMQSELAWGVTRGAGVTVAVVDSGVSTASAHLQGAVVAGTNLVPDAGDASGTTDQFGHGTAIAGQIAARAVPGSGLVGLAPEAKILPVRVFAGTDQQLVEAGLGPSTPRLAQGIRYAADQGAQIINVSMSTVEDSAELAAAVAYATERGSLVIGSAGNRDSTFAVEEAAQDGPRYPAGSPGAVGVAATDLDGVVTESSIHGPQVAISALGQSISTVAITGGDCVYSADDPKTSFAAAYVSAAAALVAAAYPDETPAQWAYRLEATAVRPDPDARNDVSGWGAVQPYDALMLVPGTGIRGPESPFPDAGAGALPTAPPETAVVVRDEPPADAAAVALSLLIAVGGLVLLGGIGAGAVFVSRRRAASAPAPVRTGRGLYDDARAVQDAPALPAQAGRGSR